MEDSDLRETPAHDTGVSQRCTITPRFAGQVYDWTRRGYFRL